MPQYKFTCREDFGGCGHEIVFECLMSELDDKKPKSCPKCRKKTSIKQVFFPPKVDIPTTVGSACDKNSDHISSDEQHHLHEKHNEYRRKPGETSWISTEEGMVHK